MSATLNKSNTTTAAASDDTAMLVAFRAACPGGRPRGHGGLPRGLRGRQQAGRVAGDGSRPRERDASSSKACAPPARRSRASPRRKPRRASCRPNWAMPSSWSIRSTAPRNSSTAAATSPSTSRWCATACPRSASSTRRCSRRFFSGRARQGRRVIELDSDGRRHRRASASRCVPASPPLTIVASRSHRTPETDRFIAEHRGGRDRVGRLVAEILPAGRAARPISIRASAAPWNGTRRPATRCCARPAASTVTLDGSAAASTASATRPTTAISPTRTSSPKGGA